MSLTRTEYMVQKIRRGQVLSQYGPYDDLIYAQKRLATYERINKQYSLGDTLRLMERDVFEWREVPSSKLGETT